MSFMILGDFSPRVEVFVERLGEQGVVCSHYELDDMTAGQTCVDQQMLAVLLYMTEGQIFAVLAALHRLAQVQYTGAILVLVNADKIGQDLAIQLLDAGADDILFSPTQAFVHAKFRAITRRSSHTHESRLEFGNTVYDLTSGTLVINDQAISLSKRDKALMSCLALRWRTDVSRQVIFAAMYGGHADVEEKIIDVYIHRLRKKLLEADSDISVQTLTGFGYRLQYHPDRDSDSDTPAFREPETEPDMQTEPEDTYDFEGWSQGLDDNI